MRTNYRGMVVLEASGTRKIWATGQLAVVKWLSNNALAIPLAFSQLVAHIVSRLPPSLFQLFVTLSPTVYPLLSALPPHSVSTLVASLSSTLFRCFDTHVFLPFCPRPCPHCVLHSIYTYPKPCLTPCFSLRLDGFCGFCVSCHHWYSYDQLYLSLCKQQVLKTSLVFEPGRHLY